MVDIVSRAKALILQPRQEWGVIAAEPADTKGLILGYAAPLALIPAVAGLIGGAMLSSMMGNMMGVRIGVFTLLLHAVVSYVLGLAGIWVLGKLIQVLAPRFGGVEDEVSAMKLAVYSPTASWLAGIFAVIPFLGFLGLLGLYSLYLFYTGAPAVTRVPQDKALIFTVVVVLCAILLFMLVGMVAGMLIGF